MFIKVIYGDAQVALINPNCHIRLIYEYIRVKAEIPDEVEIDVCDSDGTLMHINEPPFHRNGLELLEQREVYYLLLFRRDENGVLDKPILAINPDLSMFNWLRSRLRKLYKVPDSSKPKSKSKTGPEKKRKANASRDREDSYMGFKDCDL